MTSHPDTARSAKLAHRGEDSDDELLEDDTGCIPRNEDAPDVVQQLMAVFKKYGNRNQTSSRQSANPTRPSGCLNCGSVDQNVSKYPEPEVSKG